jgi:hypothetical protein
MITSGVARDRASLDARARVPVESSSHTYRLLREVALLRAATFADPAFLADALYARLEVRPLAGEAVRRLVREFLEMPADVSAKLRTLTRERRD